MSGDGARELDEDDPVPFTARLTAYHRAEESKQARPLLHDPFAEKLVGDLRDYAQQHGYVVGRGDYTIVRTLFIDNEIIGPWSRDNHRSQIVLLGAGLDARAFRLNILQEADHTIFEVDLPEIIAYKERILPSKTAPVPLRRLHSDITGSELIDQLKKKGFDGEVPTLWIMEGIAYYLERNVFQKTLRMLAEESTEGSQVFVDVCVPGLADARFGPFMMYFRWGIEPNEISSFFAEAGWDTNFSFADDHDHGRDVGQRGLLFVHGVEVKSLQKSGHTEMPQHPETEPLTEERPVDVAMIMIPEIERIIEAYEEDPKNGFESYRQFIQRETPVIRKMAKSIGGPVSVSKISPRLLRDPSTFFSLEDRKPEEELAHMVGYLEALVCLLYCSIKRLDGFQFAQTELCSLVHAAEERNLMFIQTLIDTINDELG